MPACGSKPGLDSRLRGNDNGGPGCWHHKMMKMGDIELAVSGWGLVSGSVSIRGESWTFNQGCDVDSDSDPDSDPEAPIV